MASDKDYARKVADAIIQQLQEGTAPWQKKWDSGQRFMPHNPVSGVTYKGGNSLYLLAQQETKGYADPRWMTYQQAAGEGGQVRKGEKGTELRYWQWKTERPVLDAQGNPVRDGEGKEIKETVELDRPRVRSFVVFNAQQIDGLPPPPDRPTVPSWEAHERAEGILTNSRAAIMHRPGDAAFYHRGRDEIVLPERQQFPNQGAYYGTALHELGHWTGAEKRLNRDMAHPFGSEGYAREELRAEIASLMLADELGVRHDPEQNVAYVASWIKALEQDPTEILRASADAQKIGAYVMQFDPLRQTQQRDQLAELGRSYQQQIDQAHDQAPDRLAHRAALHTITDLILDREEGWSRNEAASRPDGLGALWAQEGIPAPTVGVMLTNAGHAARWLETAGAEMGLSERSIAAGAALRGGDERQGAQLAGEGQRQAEFASVVFDAVARPGSEPPPWYVPPESREHPIASQLGQDDPVWSRMVDTLAIDALRLSRSGGQAPQPAEAGQQQIAQQDTPIAVPFVEKDEAKALGAKWDKANKTWFVPEGAALGPFAKWMAADQAQAQEPVVEAPARPITTEKTYLDVPFTERGAAKELGARWDRDAKAWYAPAGAELAAFAQWTQGTRAGAAAQPTDPHDEFAEALRKAGFRVEGAPLMDGALHRVPVDGDTGRERSGAYRAFTDGRPAGWYENHKTGERANWKAAAPSAISPDERKALIEDAERNRAARAQDQAAKHDQVASIAQGLLVTAEPAQAEHPYLRSKGVQPHGLMQATAATVTTADQAFGAGKHSIAAGDLLVPMQRADGAVRSAQVIKPDGWKGFLPGGQVSGLYAMIGDQGAARAGRPQWVAEGFATAASVHEATRDPVAVAFNASNLGNVAREMREQNPDGTLYIAGDDDRHLPLRNPPRPNVGREKAEQAAAETNGLAILPAFGVEQDGIDWNDVAQREGLPGLNRELQDSVTRAQKKEDRERREQGMPLDSLAERSENRLDATQEAIAAFRDLRGSAGLAADRGAVSHLPMPAHDGAELVASHGIETPRQNQAQKLSRRVGR